MATKLPEFSPLPPELPQSEAPQETSQSHVTNVPDHLEGHNFNPQMRAQYGNEPGVVHSARPVEPAVSEISDELRKKHEEAVSQYPFLNLSEGEFVVLNIQRHPIGLLIPVITSVSLIVLLLAGLIIYPTVMSSAPTTTMMAESSSSGVPGFGLVAVVILLLCGLIGIYGYIAVWIYLRNQFFLTNESVIQELQYSLFSHHEQTASLGSIEDVSYKKHGIWQTMFDYGSIRLSTEGEETTYRFYYVSNPKKQTATLTNAVEAYKNGRPVTGD
ncbi:MAG: hypothetical protein ACTJG2_02780 [Candidatus Saccharimonadales bacterium]